LKRISTVSAHFEHATIEPEMLIRLRSFEIEVVPEYEQNTAVLEKINEPSVEQFIANHGWVIDVEGIWECIGRRHRYPGV
jgi:hypothetical protein